LKQYEDEWDEFDEYRAQNAGVDWTNEKKIREWQGAGGKSKTNFDM
jgi:hypothetical protein